MLKTRNEVTAYLISQGKPAPLVKALVTEYLNHEQRNNDERNLIWRDPELDINGNDCFALENYTPRFDDLNTGMVPVQVTGQWAIDFYIGQEDLVELSDDGNFVLFDGEQIFDLEGNYVGN